jgi:hypothetical protein
MRKIIILIVFLTITLSTFCVINYPDVDNMLGTRDLFDWVANNIQYKQVGGWYTQKPYETLQKGYGDCKAMTVLLAYLFYKHFNIHLTMLIVDTDFDGVENHCVPVDLRSGIVYEATNGVKYRYTEYKDMFDIKDMIPRKDINYYFSLED